MYISNGWGAWKKEEDAGGMAILGVGVGNRYVRLVFKRHCISSSHDVAALTEKGLAHSLLAPMSKVFRSIEYRLAVSNTKAWDPEIWIDPFRA